jgi:hypothetical protein
MGPRQTLHFAKQVGHVLGMDAMVAARYKAAIRWTRQVGLLKYGGYQQVPFAKELCLLK